MKALVWRLDGRVIHIGDWEHQWRDREILAEGDELIGAWVEVMNTRFWLERIEDGPDGEERYGQRSEETTALEYQEELAEAGAVLGYDWANPIEGNPIPEGAVSAMEDIAEREDGGMAAADDYVSLRTAAYPSITDQLDAYAKGGAEAEAMRETVMAVKARYPKPETA